MERLSRVFHADRVLKHVMETLLRRNFSSAAIQAGLYTAFSTEDLTDGQRLGS